MNSGGSAWTAIVNSEKWAGQEVKCLVPELVHLWSGTATTV